MNPITGVDPNDPNSVDSMDPNDPTSIMYDPNLAKKKTSDNNDNSVKTTPNINALNESPQAKKRDIRNLNNKI